MLFSFPIFLQFESYAHFPVKLPYIFMYIDYINKGNVYSFLPHLHQSGFSPFCHALFLLWLPDLCIVFILEQWSILGHKHIPQLWQNQRAFSNQWNTYWEYLGGYSFTFSIIQHAISLIPWPTLKSHWTTDICFSMKGFDLQWMILSLFASMRY